jgi:hypothetical protein
MINFKQLELSHELFNRLQAEFPEIQLVEIEESPVYRDNIWVNLLMPADEDREIGLRGLAADISTDILLDYGYHISIMPASQYQLQKLAA